MIGDRPNWRRLVRAGLAGLVLVFLAAAVFGQRRELARQVDRVTPVVVIAALASVLVGLYATMLSWRAILADLGSPLPLRAAVRVFFLGQLGKYVPGSVWQLMAQMELGRDYAVGRARTATAGVLTLVVGLASGLVVATALSPLSGLHGRSRLVFLLLPVLLAFLHPRVLSATVDRGLTVLHQPRLERELSWSGLLRGFGWFVMSWLFFGVQVWILARGMGSGGVKLLLLATGAFAVAWVFGFLVLFTPAGVGAREAALVLALSPALSRASGTLVALLSRLVLTVGDVLWGLLAVAVHPPRRQVRSPRSATPTSSPGSHPAAGSAPSSSRPPPPG